LNPYLPPLTKLLAVDLASSSSFEGFGLSGFSYFDFFAAVALPSSIGMVFYFSGFSEERFLAATALPSLIFFMIFCSAS